jgi:hypothetical protein
MPAMLAIGVEVRPISKLMLTGSFTYYFDKAIDYDGSENLNVNMIDKNFLDFALGVEYGITKNVRASVAWAGTKTGVNLNYQDELSYSLNTNGIGGGFGIRISPMIDVNIGGLYTIYGTDEKTFTRSMTGTEISIPLTETYKKTTWLAAVGVDLHF